MSFLDIKALSKQWHGQTAVDQFDFSIEQGEFIALLGPSGCGKSTTLKMLAGLETPSSGNIYLAGRDITQLAPGKRGLSMVFQSYALFPHLSVKENILFGLKARRVSKPEQTRRLQEVLALVDLHDHIDKKPGQLSGGQCQRVALARAIVSQAPLCLMDEPLSNLDAKLRNEMRSEIRALQKKLGLTVIYVTHDQIEAMSMADRIILLNRGKIEQSGTPQALYDKPQSTFVAGFIGHPPMNLLHQKNHIVGVRSEHIQLASESEHWGEVTECDYQGSNTQITLKFQGQSLHLSLPGHQRYSSGARLYVTWPGTAEHYFSHTQGQRIPQPTLTKERFHVSET